MFGLNKHQGTQYRSTLAEHSQVVAIAINCLLYERQDCAIVLPWTVITMTHTDLSHNLGPEVSKMIFR